MTPNIVYADVGAAVAWLSRERGVRACYAGGAVVVAEPQDKVLGEGQCAREDPEGRHRWFTQHVADVEPQAWGAPLETDPS